MKNKFRLTSAGLHILAMTFMLFDHIYGCSLINSEILTCIGRLAFPMFAFMIVEGYFHTSNIKRYMGRLLTFGLISEIPFNLMLSGRIFYPVHQNVMFTFLFGLIAIYLLEKYKPGKITDVANIALSVSIILIGFLLSTITMVDYYGCGFLMVLVFYYTRKKVWYCYLLQIIGMYFINFEMLGGLYYPIQIGDFYFEFSQQGFAILSLIFIWLYNGEKGYNAKWFKYFCYLFYPAHALILYLLAQFVF